MANFDSIKRDARNIASTISNLTLLIDKVPDHVGRWVPPLKKFYRENKKVISAMGVLDKATKAQVGKLNLVGAAILGAKIKAAGFGKAWAVIGATAGYATSKIVKGMRDARMATLRHRREVLEAAKAQKKMAHEAKVAKIQSRGGGAGFGRLAGGAAVVAGGAKLAGAGSDAISKGDELAKQSEITTLPIRTLALFRDTADDLGISMDTVGKSILYMQRNLAKVEESGGPVAKLLRDMGVSGTELLELAPEKQFTAIGKALEDMTDPAERSAAAFDMFGRNGADLIPLFVELGRMDPEHLGRYATALAETAAAFRETAIQGRKAKDNMATVAIGAAEAVKPILDAFNEGAEGEDLKTVGKKIGETVVSGIKTGLRALRGADKAITGALGTKPSALLAGKTADNVINAKAHEVPPMVATAPRGPFGGFRTVAKEPFPMLTGSDPNLGKGPRSTLSSYSRKNAGPFMQNPLGVRPAKKGLDLLPANERKIIASADAMRTGTRKGSTPSAFGAVSRGDRERRQGFLKEQARQQSGLGKIEADIAAMRGYMEDWNQ